MPCEVVWAGFRSNTLALQQAGWKVAIQQEIHYGRIRLMLSNPDGSMYGLSRETEFDFMHFARNGQRELLPSFDMVHFAPSIRVLQIQDRMTSFRQIDAAPQFVNSEYKSIEDFGIFAAPMVRTEELIVEPADVSALLEQIRRVQSPVQREIRQREAARQRRNEIDDVRPSQVFHAQIISLDDARRAA